MLLVHEEILWLRFAEISQRLLDKVFTRVLKFGYDVDIQILCRLRNYEYEQLRGRSNSQHWTCCVSEVIELYANRRQWEIFDFVSFFVNVIRECDGHADFLSRVSSADEACFTRNGIFNCHNRTDGWDLVRNASARFSVPIFCKCLVSKNRI